MLISGLKGLIFKYPQVKFNVIHMLMATELYYLIPKALYHGTSLGIVALEPNTLF